MNISKEAARELANRWHRPKWRHRFNRDVWREVREKEERLEQQEFRRLWDPKFKGARYAKEKGKQ